MRRQFSWSLALAILASAAVLCTSVVPARAGLISKSEEIRMGRDAARQFESRYRTTTDARVEAIGARIARASDHPDYPYTFKVVDRDEVNAVSLPGGPVYIFRGLLRTVGDDDDALAGVIAHEVGHINERHAAKQVEKQMGANLLLELFTRGSTRTWAAVAANLLQLKYGRSDEYEADEVGLLYMSRAGYDPRGLARFFRKLDQSEGRGRTISWLRSHPNSGSRAQRVEEMAEDMRLQRRRR